MGGFHCFGSHTSARMSSGRCVALVIMIIIIIIIIIIIVAVVMKAS